MKKFAVLYMPDDIFRYSYKEAVAEAKRIIQREDMGAVRIVELIATAQRGIEVELDGSESEFEIPSEWTNWFRRASRLCGSGSVRHFR